MLPLAIITNEPPRTDYTIILAHYYHRYYLFIFTTSITYRVNIQPFIVSYIKNRLQKNLLEKYYYCYIRYKVAEVYHRSLYQL